jgi:hypothetical protein
MGCIYLGPVARNAGCSACPKANSEGCNSVCPKYPLVLEMRPRFPEVGKESGPPAAKKSVKKATKKTGSKPGPKDRESVNKK